MANKISAALTVSFTENGIKLSHQEIVASVRALRKRVKAGKMSVREMVEEGRRF
jgi:urease gamma subunit